MSTPNKEIFISKEELLEILKPAGLSDDSYSDITLTFDESKGKYLITKGEFPPYNPDYVQFKRYFKGKYHYEVE